MIFLCRRNLLFICFCTLICILIFFSFIYETKVGINKELVKTNNSDSSFPLDFEKYKLVLTDLGFNLARVDLNLGFIPDIVFAIDGLNEVTFIQLQDSVVIYKDEKDILLLLDSLIEAKKLSENQSIAPFVLTRVWLTIGIPPSIRLTFQQHPNRTWLTVFFQNILHFLQSFDSMNSCIDI